MRYTSAFGALASFGGSLLVPGDAPLRQLARALLDGAGLVFGLHLVVLAGLAVAASRPRSPQPVTGPVVAPVVAAVVPRPQSPITQPIVVGAVRRPQLPATGQVPADAARGPRTPATAPILVDAACEPRTPATEPLTVLEHR